jgi:proline iminopeptidase
LAVGQGHRIAWETCGNPDGRPVVVVHGGPGSGCRPWHRQMFDPSRYRIVLLDQRACGRSTPHASRPRIDLSPVTTQALVADLERLREHLGVERWLVWGGSWGSTLSLAYAETYPHRVTAMLLWGVTTGRHAEVDHVFRGGLAGRFAESWSRLREAVGARDDHDVPAACSRLLHDRDPRVRERAATAWCRWESAIETWPPSEELSERYRDPRFALAFARLVTWFASNDLFLEDGELLAGAGALGDIRVVIVQGREDIQARLESALALREVVPHAEIVVVEGGSHFDEAIERELVVASDMLAG